MKVKVWSSGKTEEEKMVKKIITFLLVLILLPSSVMAHTTILVPRENAAGQKFVKILHLHPFSGSDLMGIRLGVEDSKNLKGLAAIYMIHDGQEKSLDNVAIPDYYTVRGDKRETYTVPLNKETGVFMPGDYIIVVQHKPHWKKSEGLYRQKRKFCIYTASERCLDIHFG